MSATFMAFICIPFPLSQAHPHGFAMLNRGNSIEANIATIVALLFAPEQAWQVGGRKAPC
jgi:hypothetical protein